MTDREFLRLRRTVHLRKSLAKMRKELEANLAGGEAARRKLLAESSESFERLREAAAQLEALQIRFKGGATPLV